MYSRYTKTERLFLKGTLVSAWAFIGTSGFAGAFMPGRSVLQGAPENWVIHLAGAATLAAALVAILGVIFDKKFWWLEWVGAGFAGAGVVYYAIIPWAYFFGGEMGRLQQASTVAAALIGFIVYRLLENVFHARKLYRLHLLETSGITIQIDHGN